MSVGSFLFIQGQGYLGGYAGKGYDEIKVDHDKVIGSVTYGGEGTQLDQLHPPYITINLNPRMFGVKEWIIGDIHLDDCGQLSVRLDRVKVKPVKEKKKPEPKMKPHVFTCPSPGCGAKLLRKSKAWARSSGFMHMYNVHGTRTMGTSEMDQCVREAEVFTEEELVKG